MFPLVQPLTLYKPWFALSPIAALCRPRSCQPIGTVLIIPHFLCHSLLLCWANSLLDSVHPPSFHVGPLPSLEAGVFSIALLLRRLSLCSLHSSVELLWFYTPFPLQLLHIRAKIVWLKLLMIHIVLLPTLECGIRCHPVTLGLVRPPTCDLSLAGFLTHWWGGR